MSAPDWLGRMLDVAGRAGGLTDTTGINPVLQRQAPPSDRPRSAAVLVLFGGPADADPGAPGGLPADADVLLTQRASTLRDHSGQIAFPGGATDPGDDGPIGTALREAQEQECGDCTNLVVSLGGELLIRAEELLKERRRPQRCRRHAHSVVIIVGSTIRAP